MITVSEMTDAEQVRYFQIQDELLANRVMDQEETAKQYAALCIERARAYAARLHTMQIHAYLRQWAAEMAAASGKPIVKVHHNYLLWLEAFMVIRYGEAVEHWPAELTEQDLQRARDWKLGKDVPKFVRV